MKIRHWLRIALVATLGFLAAGPAALAQQVPNLANAVSFREIGPTHQGGRYVDYAVIESNPRIFYAATGSGGLWKTENHGTTWRSIFDDQPVISIGAVALAQSNPSIVYVGTGEANNSRSTYWGNGVYKSTNAGETWTNVGLPNSGHVGRIVVHPANPNIVFVAALGHLYSQNPDRGLYRTTDGGRTWTKVLDHRVDGREIGVVEVQMDPSNPQVLYAATYDKVRRPWTFGEGGPGSRVFKSTNGGTTWTQLTNGLPTGMSGRIGISIARNAPRTVYAVIENADSVGMPDAQRRARLAQGFGGGTVGDELFRSDDAGATWRKVAPAPAPSGAAGGRGGGRGGFGANPPYYYGQIRVNPLNREHLYLMSVGMTHSTDGGRTWTPAFGFGGDHHAMWINPRDSLHMIVGHDHGMGVTFDGGRTWLRPDNKPLAQYYAVGYDMEVPYNVYGGLQDNGSQKGPSTRRGGENIPFELWYRVGGGDGMYNVVDPNDSRWLYNESQFGNIQRMDQQTGQGQSIRYTRPQGQPALRWNWNAPIHISPHNSNVIYHGANVLLRSPFRGNTWEEISPDLTVHDSSRRNGTGNIQYATITSVEESSIVPGLIWVGTDDGNVQLTRNGGANWTNLRSRINGHPGHWVSRVVASYHDPAVAYVTVTGYRADDFRPYVWKTTDYGQTWTSIAGNLPNEPINVIREDRRNPNLLFVGSELGLHVTLDGGRLWTRLRNGMPTNPVHDLQIHPRDNEVIAATHGRGIFIADIRPLQQLSAQVASSDAYLFEPQPTIQWAPEQRPVAATVNFAGESRPAGVAISYYLRTAVSGGVTVRVYDGARVIAETNGPGGAGIQTVRWNMQAQRTLTEAEMAGAGGRGGRGGRGGGRGGAGGRGGGRGAAGGDQTTVFPAGGAPNTTLTSVAPGAYRVVLTVGGREQAQTAVILEDVWAKR